MNTPRLMNPSMEPMVTLEQIGYFVLLMIAILVFVIYMELRKEKNNGINRPIFYCRNRFWHWFVNRRFAYYSCLALFGFCVGYWFDRISNIFR